MARFDVESVFKGRDKITAPVSRMRNNIGKLTRSINRGFRNANRAVNKFGRGLKSAARIGAAALAGLGFAMFSIIRTGAEFGQALVNAAAKFPEGIRRGTKAFEALDKVARAVGAATEFTATQAAKGLNFLAMAGFNAKQAIVALPGIVDLATAAQIDLATASDIATDSLGAFGLATKDTTQLGINLARVNDVLAKTSVTANTTMEQMFEAIVKGAPTFTAAGQSIESFSALIGVMANSGIKGGEAGTILRNTILRLSNPAGQAAKIMKDLGVRVADSSGNFRDILDIMEDFEKGLKGMGEVQRSAALGIVFGTRAVSGLSVQLKEGTTSISKFRKILKGATGAASEMAAVMRDTLQGRINAMVSSFEGLKITLFSLKNTALAGVIERITEFIRTVDKAINANKKLATELIDGLFQAAKGIIGIFGVLIGMFVALKTIMLTVSTVTVLWKAGIIGLNIALGTFKVLIFAARLGMLAFNLAMAANPIGAIIVAVTLLIGLGVLLIKNWDNIVSAITSAVSKIKTVLAFLISPFEKVLTSLSVISKAGIALGFIGERGEEEGAKEGGAAPGAQVITPGERTARTITESRETSAAELTIKDETGRAEMTEKGNTPGVALKLIDSGSF